MTIIELFLSISFLVILALGFLVSSRPSAYRKINIIFSFLCLACALWILGALMVIIMRQIQWKLFWIRFVFGVFGFIPAIFVHFSYIFPAYKHHMNFLKILILYSPSLIFLAFSPTDLIIKSILQIEPYEFEYGMMHRFLSFYVIVYLSLGFHFLWRSYRNAIGIQKLQIKYFFIGMLLTAIVGLITNLFSAIIFSLLLLVALLFNQIKPGTEKVVEYLLFKNKYDYRKTLGNFSRAMVSILDLQSLSKRIIETIAQTMGVEKASLFLLNEEKGGYALRESKNINIASLNPMLLKGDPLPRYLQKIGEIIVREELIKGANIIELKSVIDQMGFLEAEVSIPLISKGHLIGMINLSQKFNKDVYYREDIELLSTLANQTSIAIENARLYEDLKKSKSYMRRADRLASLGTLAAGLAHEIRNPLVAIKTFTQLLPERFEDEEFRTHFTNIASAEVDRISSFITELLDFARPSDPRLEYEDINGILEGMILLISNETKKKQINIIKNYASDLPLVQLDREQIKQVFLNILLNSIEATPEKGEILIKTHSFERPEGEPYIQVEFTDNGRGIPAEHLEDIFTPFFTTKEKGSGLGLSISQQIVQDHRGYINVESELGKGTSFFINLPLNQANTGRRKEDLEIHQDFLDSL